MAQAADKDHSDEDSYEKFKSYLQESIGFEDLKAPPKIMTPCQMYALELSCQNGSRGKISIRKEEKKYVNEWKNLAAKKQEYYRKCYEIRKRQRTDLLVEYEMLKQHKKNPSAYICYFRKRYEELSSNFAQKPEDITKKIAHEWKVLSSKMKEYYRNQAQMLKDRRKWNYDTKKEIQREYQQKLKDFLESINQDKEKIIKRFSIKKEVIRKKEETDKKIDQNVQEKEKSQKNKNQQKKVEKNIEVKIEPQNIKKPKTKEKKNSQKKKDKLQDDIQKRQKKNPQRTKIITKVSSKPIIKKKKEKNQNIMKNNDEKNQQKISKAKTKMHKQPLIVIKPKKEQNICKIQRLRCMETRSQTKLKEEKVIIEKLDSSIKDKKDRIKKTSENIK